jgi:hypothetical protein
MAFGLILCLVMGLLMGSRTGRAGPSLLVLSVAGVLLVAMLLFATLTVVVREGAVEILFGLGVVRKHVPLDEFVSVRIVRNKWYYGWGIRLIPRGWLYNVSGLDAVELLRKHGRVLRIGTDEPAKLERAIRDAAGGTLSSHVEPAAGGWTP